MKKLPWLFVLAIAIYLRNGTCLLYPSAVSFAVVNETGSQKGQYLVVSDPPENFYNDQPVAIVNFNDVVYAERRDAIRSTWLVGLVSDKTEEAEEAKEAGHK